MQFVVTIANDGGYDMDRFAHHALGGIPTARHPWRNIND